MLFHTTAFALFFPLVVFLSLVTPRLLLYPVLIIASYFFYGWGAGWYVLLLLMTSTLDYFIAASLHDKPTRRKFGILVSAVINFGILAYFKYANFALDNIESLANLSGIEASFNSLDVILPIGISFYTFQSFSYVADVLSGRTKPCRSITEYLLYVSWFPQLIAGPISRASHLIPQISAVPTQSSGMPDRLPRAIILFAEGWMRKAFADLAAISVEYFYSQDPALASGSMTWYAVIGFAFQIYGDFSGYSRMAQGLSWLFGVNLIDNFNIPYAANSIQDFWRRWHISLSTWFRDYVYIPLGGNRKGSNRTHLNLILTMLLCGLWHGASWNFVLWGGIHGAFLIFERWGRGISIPLPRLVRHALVIFIVFLAWVPFRATNLDHALATYVALFNPGWALPSLTLIISVVGIILCDLQLRVRSVAGYGSIKRSCATAAIWLSVSIIVWQITEIVGRKSGAEFIYFQF